MSKETTPTVEVEVRPVPPRVRRAVSTVAMDSRASEIQGVIDRAQAIRDSVDRWFVDTFHNRGINENEMSRLQQAKSHLKDLLLRITH